MKVLIASTIVPFVEGGGTFIVDWTAKKLREFGHQVEVFKIPFSHYPPYMIEQMLAVKLFNVADSCDRLVSIRTPSYLLQHSNHICWFIHHYRLAYELWDTSFQTEITKDADGLRFRQTILNADNHHLRKLKKIFTNSKEVSGRLKKYNNLDSEVLYPPLMDPEDFFCDTYGDYIYYSSRLAANKRQLLAVEAMKYTKTKVKLVISGKADTQPYVDMMQKCIEQNNLSQKVKIIDTWISKTEKAKFFSTCLAAIYIPFDEDSYGYPSLEAFSSKKAVITCSDSGGTDELIIHNVNGKIIKPTPEALAEVMDELYENKKKAKDMGQQGFKNLIDKGITWEYTINKLVADY